MTFHNKFDYNASNARPRTPPHPLPLQQPHTTIGTPKIRNRLLNSHSRDTAWSHTSFATKNADNGTADRFEQQTTVIHKYQYIIDKNGTDMITSSSAKVPFWQDGFASGMQYVLKDRSLHPGVGVLQIDRIYRYPT